MITMNKPVLTILVSIGMSAEAMKMIADFTIKQAETKKKIDILTTRIPQRDKNESVTNKLWEPKK